MNRKAIFFSLVLTATATSRVNAQTQDASAPSRATPTAATSATVVPMLVRYDGVAASSPAKSPAIMTFLIFKDHTGGDPLWAETQSVATDASGRYEVYLGSTYSSGLPPALFGTGEARWLEVQVAGETVAPRTLLTSVPYALKAADAATLGGLPASAFALAGTTGVATVQANALTPDAASNVTTTGGTNFYLPRFTGSNTIASSEIYDSGTSVGIGVVPNAGVKLDVGGAMIMRGNMTVSRTGNATSSQAYPSYGFDFFSNVYNSSTKAVDNPYFQLQSEPTGNNTASPSATFNLLFANNGSAVAETGLYFNPNGTIHFASGQTFPGTGTGNGSITGVTPGFGLTGGGSSGNVTLNVNAGAIPTLSGNNYLSGNNTFAGSSTFGPNTFNASINANNDINIDNTSANAGALSPGLRFGSDSGEGMSSQRTSAGKNQYGLDLYTAYAARLSITSAGRVGIGTETSDSQLTVVSAVGSSYAISAFGSSQSGENNGLFAQGSSTDGSSGLTGGNGGVFVGGNADTTDDAGVAIYAFPGRANDHTAKVSAVFDSDITVAGTVHSAGAAIEMDHPSDPANKYLSHASVQSSELMNLYTGNVTTDGSGHATVALPSWFEAENADFRYQLTVVGQQAQAWVAKKVGAGQFEIATSPANVEVSWQITAVRQDAYAKAHPLIVEQAKPAREVGFYNHPELYGQPATKQTEWGRHPLMMKHIEAERAAAKARSSKVAAVAVENVSKTQ